MKLLTLTLLAVAVIQACKAQVQCKCAYIVLVYNNKHNILYIQYHIILVLNPCFLL